MASSTQTASTPSPRTARSCTAAELCVRARIRPPRIGEPPDAHGALTAAPCPLNRAVVGSCALTIGEAAQVGRGRWTHGPGLERPCARPRGARRECRAAGVSPSSLCVEKASRSPWPATLGTVGQQVLEPLSRSRLRPVAAAGPRPIQRVSGPRYLRVGFVAFGNVT
jgi:hypothetical protein